MIFMNSLILSIQILKDRWIVLPYVSYQHITLVKIESERIMEEVIACILSEYTTLYTALNILRE